MSNASENSQSVHGDQRTVRHDVILEESSQMPTSFEVTDNHTHHSQTNSSDAELRAMLSEHSKSINELHAMMAQMMCLVRARERPSEPVERTTIDGSCAATDQRPKPSLAREPTLQNERNNDETDNDDSETVCLKDSDSDAGSVSTPPLIMKETSSRPQGGTFVINQIQPPNFDGERSRARTWLREYETTMEINGYDDTQKMRRARAYLQGVASQWMNTMLLLHPDLNWCSFKSRFTRHFCGAGTSELLRKNLHEARQKPSEPPADYLVRIVDICKEFKPEMAEPEMIGKIADGMTRCTFNMLSSHRHKDDWSIDWILKIFARCKPEEAKSESNQGRRRSATADPEPRDQSNLICYNCKEQGHMSRDCKLPRDEKRIQETKSAAASARAQSSVGVAKNTNQEKRTISSVDNHVVETLTAREPIFACDSLPKPTLILTLNGVPFCGRVDTGADMTILPHKIALQLNLQLLPWEQPALKSFGNHEIGVLGMAAIVVSHNGCKRAILVAIVSDRAIARPLWGIDVIDALSLVEIKECDLGTSSSRDKVVFKVAIELAHPLDKVTYPTADETTRGLVEETLVEFNDVFSRNETDIGRTKTVKHRIVLTDDKPISKRPYRTAIRDRDSLEETINRLLKTGAIRPSTSPYSSPSFFVEKDHGKAKRLVADYRPLNAKTVLDRMPMPHPEDVFAQLHGAKTFCKLDIKAMFNQIEIDERDIEKTAFSSPFGLFECPLMSFGLVNAPATAVRLMREVLRDLDGKICYVYFDDIIIYAENVQELMQRCRSVFERLRLHNLKLSPEKCSFALETVQYLGHVVSARGIEIDPRRIEQVKKFPVPRNPSDVRSFHGLCSYNRKFIRNFAEIAKPLTPLMGKPSDFLWTSEAQSAFEKLRDALTQAPVLVHFDPHARHELRTDASSYAVGAILHQIHQDPSQTGTVLYYSKTLTSAQKNYSATERELLAAFQSISELKHYLLGKEFTLVTDHAALSLIHNNKDPHHRLARWVAQLQCYSFKIEYKRGDKHLDADCMSRLINTDNESEDTDVDGNADLMRAICQLTLQDSTSEGQAEVENYLVDIRSDQRSDELCKKYIDILESDLSESEKSRLAMNYTLQDNQLYRLSSNNAPALVVPARHRVNVLTACHDVPLAGHLGFSRTYVLIRKRFYWPKMRRDVKKYVASCHGCQRRKVSNKRKQGFIRPLPIAEDVFDTVGIDLITKLPRSNGYNSILVCTDNLSKFVITVPLRDEQARSLIHAFHNFVIAKHGCPRVVLSDRGSNMMAEETKDFFRLFGIKRIYTSAYHPQTNGQTERFNRTLAASLTQYVCKRQNDWSDYLQALTFAYNVTEHSVTRVTPFELIYHRRPRLPIDNVLERSEFVDPTRPAPGTLSSETVKTMKKYIIENQLANKRRLDARLDASDFEEGQLVLVERPTRKKGAARKLQYTYIGPYKILKKIDDLSFKIGFLSGRPQHSVVHPCHLRHYVARPEELNLENAQPSFVPKEFVAARETDQNNDHTIANVASEADTETASECEIDHPPYSPLSANGLDESFMVGEESMRA